MKRKFNIFAVLLLTMTLIFGSTLCYAAEGEETDGAAAAEESGYAARSVNTQTDSVPKSVYLGSTGAWIDIRLEYAWDEGYTGWFTGASHTLTCVPSDVNLILWSVSFSGTGSSYVTVTVDYSANNIREEVTKVFYVDGYGDVY